MHRPLPRLRGTATPRPPGLPSDRRPNFKRRATMQTPQQMQPAARSLPQATHVSISGYLWSCSMTDRIFLLAAALALASCSTVRPAADAPRLTVTCPDPAGRSKLTAGSTYRDLAVARVEAIWGWQVCHDALRISQD